MILSSLDLTAVFTRKRDAVGTDVAFWAVPFSPISACATIRAVPGTVVLDDLLPAE